MKKLIIILVVYVLVGIFTYGHSFTTIPDTQQEYFAGVEYTTRNGPGVKAFVSIFAALVWPLYWSVELQK